MPTLPTSGILDTATGLLTKFAPGQGAVLQARIAAFRSGSTMETGVGNLAGTLGTRLRSGALSHAVGFSAVARWPAAAYGTPRGVTFR